MLHIKSFGIVPNVAPVPLMQQSNHDCSSTRSFGAQGVNAFSKLKGPGTKTMVLEIAYNDNRSEQFTLRSSGNGFCDYFGASTQKTPEEVRIQFVESESHVYISPILLWDEIDDNSVGFYGPNYRIKNSTLHFYRASDIISPTWGVPDIPPEDSFYPC